MRTQDLIRVIRGLIRIRMVRGDKFRHGVMASQLRSQKMSKRDKRLAEMQDAMRSEIPVACEIGDDVIPDDKAALPLGVPFTENEWRSKSS